MRTVRTRVLALAAAGGVLITAPAAAGALGRSASPQAAAAVVATESPWVDPDTVRGPVPANRYEPAGGCYTIRSLSSGRYVTRSGGSFAATAPKAQAEPFHFQAFDLGKYLLFGSRSTFLSAPVGPGIGAAANQVADKATGAGEGLIGEGIDPVRDPALDAAYAAEAAGHQAGAAVRDAALGDAVEAAAKPGAHAEWVLRTAPGGFTFQHAVDDHDEADPGAPDPEIAGTLTAANSGRLTVADGASTAPATRFALERSSGCASWPEIGTQVVGPPGTGATSYGETQGYIDTHLHGMAFEFLTGNMICGRPWHPYGVTYALVDCKNHGPDGRAALAEDFLSGKAPGSGHDTVGWPTFNYWPDNGSYTHQQSYYTWLERAWRGGLRIFTNLLVENSVLCEIYPYKKNSCNEMDSVRLQAERMRELERYIDALSGGPGKGWYRIVEDPFEARRVVNAGKLAVVMGIEVSTPFDCGEYLGRIRCTEAELEQRIQEVYDLGVRQMELTNKFDNGLTGVTGDGEAFGALVNSANRYETGHYWKMQTCADPDTEQHDKRQYNLADESGTNEYTGRDSIFGAVLQIYGKTGTAPVYGEGPHCNAIGLTERGKQALDGLMARGMIFDPDHMSALARQQSLDHLQSAGYSGVLSSHSWADDATYRRILEMGGVVTPHGDGSAGFVAEWQKLRLWADDRYLFGVGYGSDINGFSATAGPRNPGEASDVDYPFTGLGGVKVHKQVSGKKTYDINTQGVEHYGLFADWVEDGRMVAGVDGDAFVRDMRRGSEAFLQMWERAIGVRPNACRADVADLTASDLGQVKAGMTAEQVLATLGQPEARQGNTFTYCSTGGTATVTFGGDGRVA